MMTAAASLTALLVVAQASAGFSQNVRDTVQLKVRTDLKCRLTVDGVSDGVVRGGEGIRISLAPGEHHLEAVPVAGGARWQESIKVTGPQEQSVFIPLQQEVTNAQAERKGYWAAPDQHLMWATVDNGSGVTFHQAEYYCHFLTLGGHRDWTLPAIDDLQKLFGGAPDAYGHRVNGPTKLTGWSWSASEGKEPGEHWALDFGDGGRASLVEGDSGLNRALCVRRAK